jgi:deoxycytidylate deaminase
MPSRHRAKIRRADPRSPARNASEPTRVDPFELAEPELVIGLVAGVGAPLDQVQELITRELADLDYRTDILHLSQFTRHFDLTAPIPRAPAGEAARIDALMNRGNEARKVTGRNDILALAAIADIHLQRGAKITPLPKRCFVLRQLKHPDEVVLLRRVYRDGFLLVGVYCPQATRKGHLQRKRMSQTDVDRLIARDEHEPSESGQHLRDTFHLADVFVEMRNRPQETAAQLRRFFQLLFGVEIISPKLDEFGMLLASTNGLRSAQLGRQVGAAILSRDGDVIAVGTNEVPSYGGGVYWEGQPGDQRDHIRGQDSSDQMREEIVSEITERLTPGWARLSSTRRRRLIERNLVKLRSTTVASLTEFGRAVHAEAEAILSAARMGLSTRGSLLYCTTFPCHVCAKHIVGAGIGQVTYIEPYPKSKASELHADSISLEEAKDKRVVFRPFVGVAPRRFAALFSMRLEDGVEISRKDKRGAPIRGRKRIRLAVPHFSALDREKYVAKQLGELTRKGGTR